MTINLVDQSEMIGRNAGIVGRKCCRCGATETFINKETGKAAWYKKKEKINGFLKWDGNSYYCDSCEHKMRKKCRNKEIEKDSNMGKGFRVEQAVAKSLNIKNCNIESDNFNYSFDLYDPSKYKSIQIRSRKLTKVIRKWKNKDGTEKIKEYFVWEFGNIKPFREFDNLCGICMTENYKDIERIYIIPVDVLPASEGITIYRELKSKYDDYRLDEQGDLFNKIKTTYSSMKIDDCPVIKS